jgi:hypothetical protein
MLSTRDMPLLEFDPAREECWLMITSMVHLAHLHRVHAMSSSMNASRRARGGKIVSDRGSDVAVLISHSGHRKLSVYPSVLRLC